MIANNVSALRQRVGQNVCLVGHDVCLGQLFGQYNMCGTVCETLNPGPCFMHSNMTFEMAECIKIARHRHRQPRHFVSCLNSQDQNIFKIVTFHLLVYTSSDIILTGGVESTGFSV
jgi:hypothetical protein